MKSYYPTVNLLRAIAAIMVCLGHFIGYVDPTRGSLFTMDGWLFGSGKIGLNGVFIFFVVSGFVIPLSLFKQEYRITKLPRFLLRRFIRIELPYIASITGILLIRLIYSFKNHTPFDFNLEQLFYHVVYYIPFTDMEWLDGAYWTLAIEFQFYMAIGLIWVLFSSKNKWLTLVSVLVFAGSSFIVSDDRFIFHYSIIFAQGILLSLIKAERIKLTEGLIGIVLCLISTTFLFSVEVSVFCLLTVLCILYLNVDHKLINRLGDISYSLYLTHVTIGSNLLYLFYKYFNGTIERLILVLLVFISAIIFSSGFWLLIENPSRKLSKKVRL